MNQSEILFARAKASIPGGVNSPVRAFKSVTGCPIFFKQGQGAYLEDVDGKRYLDYVGSWGPLILGHCHPAVVQAVQAALTQGMSFGAPTEIEIILAEKIRSLMPNIEKLRMVNSGTEATMTAIRLARGYTGREKILKFNGCYHGHSDSLLVRAGSGLLTLGIPSSPGVLQGTAEHTLSVDFNDLEAVKACFAEAGDSIAAVIIEPVAGNMGLVKPKPGFLEGLRAICDQYESLLIFDEVMTGFRVAQGGAQAYYGIRPDLTTLGKVIGAGMPVGALGGLAKIMDKLAPEGAVYQAGTLSGNPLAMAAGLACLQELEKPLFYEQLEQSSQALARVLEAAAAAYGIPFHADAIGGMFGFYFTQNKPIESFADVDAADKARFIRFYHGMLEEGVYFAPSMYEAGFISSVHTAADIQQTGEAAKRVFARI